MKRFVVAVLASLVVGCGSHDVPSAPRPPSARVAPTPPAVAPPPSPIIAAPEGTAQPAPIMLAPGFDLRGVVVGEAGKIYVASRGHAQPSRSEDTAGWDDNDTARVRARVVSRAPSGVPVRILGEHGTCDGTLGARYALTAEDSNFNDVFQSAFAHEVIGCHDGGWLAILNPPSASTMPVALAANDPAGQPAIDAAREAAARVGHLPSGPWLPPRLYRLGDAVYAIVAGPTCPDDDVPCTTEVGAVARVRVGKAAEVLLARPAHFVWEEAMCGFFSYPALTDVDADGVVELLEFMGAEQGTAVRLVRPGARPAGDVAWLLTVGSDVPFPRHCDPAPRPPAAAVEPP